MFKLLGAVVPEEDGEHLEVDDSFEQVSYAFEQIVYIEDAGDFAGDLVEDCEGFCLAGDRGVEAGVLDGDGHAGGYQFEQALVVRGEERGNFGLDVDDADYFVFDEEGNGQFGAYLRVGIDVVLGAGDIFEADGAALEGGLAYYPPAGFDADALDLGGVSGLEAHPELVGAVVEEEDGEDAVVDDGADQVGHPVHEGVEVEGGVEGVGESVEEVDLEGFDADVGGEIGVESLGPVVSFKGVAPPALRGRGWDCGGFWEGEASKADDTTG